MPVLLILIWLLILPSLLAAQDTRGALVPDAPVTLADGSVLVAEDLKVGSLLRVWTGTAWASSPVTSVRRQHIDSFLLVKAGDREFRASGSHRVALADGRLIRVDTLKVGDNLWVEGPNGPLAAVVSSIRLYPANMVAYDLTVAQHSPFVVGGVVVGD